MEDKELITTIFIYPILYVIARGNQRMDHSGQRMSAVRSVIGRILGISFIPFLDYVFQI